MEKRTSVPARAFAVATLAVAIVVAIVVIGGALGSGGSADHGHHRHARREVATKERRVPATYVVQSGDTLIAIAHRTGVPVVRIEALNPQVDPQILIAGEKLKLRR